MPLFPTPKDLTKKELKEFVGHKDEVNCVSYSSDFQFMITGSDDQRVRVFNVKTKQCIIKLKGHEGAVKSVAVSPCDRFFASASFDKTARIWRTSDGLGLHVLEGHAKSVEVVTFSPGSIFLCTGSWDRTAIIWSVQTGGLLQTLSGHGSLVQAVAFSKNCDLVATGSWDYTVRVWRLPHASLKKALDESIKEAEMKSEDVDLTSEDEEKTEIVTNGIEDDETREKLSTDSQIKHHNVTVSRTDDVSDVLDKEKNGDSIDEELDAQQYPACQTTQMPGVFSRDDTIIEEDEDGIEDQTSSKTLSSEVPDKKLDVNVHIYNNLVPTDNKEEKSDNFCEKSEGSDNELQENSDTKNIDGSNNCEISLNNEKFNSEGETENNSCGDPGSNQSKENKQSNQSQGQEVLILEGHTGNVRAVSFSRIGMLASGSWDKTIRLWNPRNGKCLRLLEGHQGWVQAVSFSHDATFIASAADDDSVKVWDIPSGDCINTLEGSTDMAQHCAFTKDGLLIASGAAVNETNKLPPKTDNDGQLLTLMNQEE